MVVDDVVKSDNILCFKYFYHVKTDRAKPVEDDLDAWGFTSCKEMIDVAGDFSWPFLKHTTDSSDSSSSTSSR